MWGVGGTSHFPGLTGITPKAQHKTAGSLPASQARTRPGGHQHWSKAWGSGLGEVGRKRPEALPQAPGSRIHSQAFHSCLTAWSRPRNHRAPEVWAPLDPKVLGPHPIAWTPWSPPPDPSRAPTSSSWHHCSYFLPRLLHYFTPTSRPWFSSEGWKRRRKEGMGGSRGPESALQLGVQPRGLHGDLPLSPFQAASRDKHWPTKLGYDN